uniref:Uncharacterized protein n=1 Tax=Peronospora matthiolae TaxID=2874970 RepID=A0AAV1T8M8_9STRA
MGKRGLQIEIPMAGYKGDERERESGRERVLRGGEVSGKAGRLSSTCGS